MVTNIAKMPDKPITQKPEKRCLDAALRLLSRRDHSLSELSKKLKGRGFSNDQITWTIDQCHRYDYLDDERFAHDYTRQLQRRGYGIRRIRQLLQAKGLARDLTDETVMRHCTDKVQLEQCRNLLCKKLKPAQSTQPAKALKPKLYRYLLGRGFLPSTITAALDSALVDSSP